MKSNYKLKYLTVLDEPIMDGGDECWHSFIGKSGNVYYAYDFDVSDEDKACSVMCGKVLNPEQDTYMDLNGSTLEEIENSIEIIEASYENQN